MKSLQEISYLCRLCLAEDDVNTPIFDVGDTKQIYLKVATCLPISISREDKLPKQICESCSCKLDTFYEFWKTSCSSEKQLHNWLNLQSVATYRPNSSDGNTVEHTVKEEVYNLESQSDVSKQITATSENIKRPEKRKASKKIKTSDEIIEISDASPTKRTRWSAAPKTLFETPESEDESDYDDTVATKVEDYYDYSDADKSEDNVNIKTSSDKITKSDEPRTRRARRAAAPKPLVETPESDYEDMTAKLEQDSDYSDIAAADKFDNDNVDSKEDNNSANEHSSTDHLNSSLEQSTEEPLAADDAAKSIKSMTSSSTPHKCPICGKCYNKRTYLKVHIKRHTDQKKYPCEICFKKFKRKSDVVNHLQVHDENRAYRCDICDKVLKTKGSLTTHRKRHLREYKVMCPECNHGFFSKHEYQLHAGSRHGKSMFICGICQRSCYDKAKLQLHMMTHNKDYKTNKQFECDICKTKFLNKLTLGSHIRRFHRPDGHARHMCDLCGKKLSSRTSLRDHLILHQGLKPIECRECGKCFANKTTLKIHMRTHTGERPYTCEFCKKSFSQRSQYTIHLRYHTGERPYVCILCQEGFVCKSVMELHIRNKHKHVPIEKIVK